MPAETRNPAAESAAPNAPDSYVMPLIHLHIPRRGVDTGFWVGLGVTTAVGAVDPPLAVLLGAGVLVARHHQRQPDE